MKETPLELKKIMSVLAVVTVGALVLGAGECLAQKTISGTVSDAKTGETLPSANISIEGTYRGTISNSSGEYSLVIPDSLLPATVVIRFIGYNSEERAITSSSDNMQDILMQPSVTELGEITVTGEDPAIEIMREVIRRKQVWRRLLDAYRAEAYTRQTLENDTSIVMITETESEAFWDKEKGHREVLKSRRQTANIEASDNFAGVSYLPNFYDDNVSIAGFDLVGVTHPDALKFYEFRLNDYQTIDDQTVYEIEVIPARKLQPLFEGTIHVLDEEYALLDVRIKPNEVVKFPPPVKSFDSYYEQQFNNFGKDFWLPVDMHLNGTVKISMIGLEFPLIRFTQLSRITNYQVNVELPDSLFEEERMFTVDSTSVAGDSLRVTFIEKVPLSREEKEAYASLDSTATLEKAFKPSGFLARFIDDDDGDQQTGGPGFLSRIPGSISPRFRYNRVDELHAGLNYDIRLGGRLRWKAGGGYSTGYNRWDYASGLEFDLLQSRRFRGTAGISYWSQTDTRYESHVYRPGFTLVPNLLGNANYFDYFRNEGIRLSARMNLRRLDLSVEAGYKSEDHSSLSVNSSYDLMARRNRSPVNIPVDEGRLQALMFKGGYNLEEEFPADIITGLKRIEAGIEHSSAGLGSDFKFTTYRIEMNWNFPTFYRRRFLPNTLDVKLTAGTYSGNLPIQKMGIVDASLGYFSPFGVLKTIRNRPYEGEQYLSLAAEHNFRTIPFEAMGLRFLSDRNIGLIVFGGLARTWLSNSRQNSLETGYGYIPRVTDKLHVETGISVNSLFGLFRVDVAVRLDEPAFLINYSIARLF